MAMFQALAVKKGALVRDNFMVDRVEKGPEGGIVVKTSSGEDFRNAKSSWWVAGRLGPASMEHPSGRHTRRREVGDEEPDKWAQQKGETERG